MGTFRLYVRFPDGEIWHGVYDSVTDTAARFLTPTADDVAGWAMEDEDERPPDGAGEPVEVATDYDDIHWPGTAVREGGPGEWCWLTGGWEWTNETVREGMPDWLVEHLAASAFDEHVAETRALDRAMLDEENRRLHEHTLRQSRSAQPEYPPPRAWPRARGVHHVRFDETAHPVGECTDACRATDGPYAARPGWIVRVQRCEPLHDPDAGDQQAEGRDG